jgi:transposase
VQMIDTLLCACTSMGPASRATGSSGFNKIKHCRRVATRYDKLAANYLAFVKLACIRLWLRVYEFTA